MPDFGHASLEVVDERSGDTTYISYWPEIESLIGEVTQAFKHRKRRHPVSYAQESDQEDGYMQRPAEAHATLHGLDERRVLTDWVSLQDSKYDAFKWNCSSLCKYLLLASMSKADYARVAPVANCSDEDAENVTSSAAILDRISKLSLSKFVDCTPEDVFRMALAFNDSTGRETASEAVQ